MMTKRYHLRFFNLGRVYARMTNIEIIFVSLNHHTHVPGTKDGDESRMLLPKLETTWSRLPLPVRPLLILVRQCQILVLGN